MKKDMKKVYSYALIMIVAVLIIVLISCMSESRLDNAQKEYRNTLTAHEGEIERLEAEISELRENLNENIEIQSKLDRHNQIMNDLTEVYNLIKDGDRELATEKFEKIETIGFDNGELVFYDLIKKELGIEDK